MKTSPAVTIPRLMRGHDTGGLEFAEWLAASPAERLVRRLQFIFDEATPLAEAVYSQDSGYPANILADARRLRELAAQAVAAAERGDLVACALLCLDVGSVRQGVDETMAAWAALRLAEKAHRPRSAGGAATAGARRLEQRHRMAEIARRWRELGAAGRPERDRAAIIAQRMCLKADTVRRLLRKAGLR